MATVVVGVDSSDFSLDALRCAADRVDEIDGGQLVVLFAKFVYVALPNYVGEAIYADALQSEERYVRDRVTRALAGRRTSWCFVTRYGEPARVIREVARETGARFVVVGHYTRSRAAEVVLGSVSRRLVRSADCPVLVVDRRKGRHSEAHQLTTGRSARRRSLHHHDRTVRRAA
jgi:nucleotide-binding universal stress UspA family protein